MRVPWLALAALLAGVLLGVAMLTLAVRLGTPSGVVGPGVLVTSPAVVAPPTLVRT